MKKNVSGQKVGAQLVSATDGSAFTSSVTAYITLDAGTQAVGTVGSGACTHEGNGYHTYAPSQAETNGDLVAVTFVGSGAVPVTVQIYTGFPQTVDNATNISAIKTKTDNLPTDPADASDIAARFDTVDAAIATIDGVVDAILVDTAEIGTAGAGLTAVPWNASWDAEVQSEVADGLTAYGAATATDVSTAAANVSVDEIQATALADLFNTNSGTTYASAVAGSVVKEIADNAGGSSLTAADIADAVWEEAIADHSGTAGSTAEQLAAAGAAGDPWATSLPGSYTAGQAGKIVGDNLNATVSSRLASASYTAPLDAAGIRSAVGLASADLDTQLTAIDDYLDTEVSAIKAKTDNLPANPAAVSDIPTAIQNADALLNRDMSAVSDTTARSPLNALRALRNKVSTTATTATVTKEDDTTTAWTAAITTDAAANPITVVDPA